VEEVTIGVVEVTVTPTDSDALVHLPGPLAAQPS